MSEAEVVDCVPLEDRLILNVALEDSHRPVSGLLRDRMKTCTGLRSFSDEPTILRSIRDRLLTLPDDTVVHTGHGDSTMIGDERERVTDRIAELGVA